VLRTHGQRGVDVPPQHGSRIDLHLHSRASTDTGSWFLNTTLMPESFVIPEDAYATCKRRGMDLVTLTDHNTISGALEIAHHPDVVIGVEITAMFPSDRVPVHVLAWGVDEPAWDDLSRARENLFDLVTELESRNIPHALAHPLHRVGDTLSVEHIEQCLLLFRMWEGRNGARPQGSNEVAVRIAQSASPQLLARLAEKHGIAPRTDGPPALTAGSDDHSLLETAGTWTITPVAQSPDELLAHLRSGAVAMGGGHGSATALAHAIGTLPLKRYLMTGATDLPPQLRNILADVAKHPLGTPDLDAKTEGLGIRLDGIGADVMKRLRADTKVVREFRRLGRQPDSPTRSRERLLMVTKWLHREALAGALGGDTISLGSLGRRLDALIAAAGLAAPYYFASRYMRAEHSYALEFERDFFGGSADVGTSGAPHALVLTDTFDEINGAAGTMRRLAAWSAEQVAPPVTVVTVGPKAERSPGLIRLPSVADLPIPAYGDEQWRLGIASAFDLLEAIDLTGARIIHMATPGPLGVAGLLAARILDIPFVASYHTELGDYAMQLTGDRIAAEVTRRAVSWIYGHADLIYVPTHATGRGLLEQGIDPEALYVFGRGVDTDAFNPNRSSWMTRRRMGGKSATVALYVGRISREKGLDTLAQAFRIAAAQYPDLELVLVGDGPFRSELAELLAGTKHRFLGEITGPALGAVYASADMFCLPSRTETFGQVVLEASASGLPVIVSDSGGAHESVIDGHTGIIVHSDAPAAFAEALCTLAADPERRRLMGETAHEVASQRSSWAEIFMQLTDSYTHAIPTAMTGARHRSSHSVSATPRTT